MNDVKIKLDRLKGDELKNANSVVKMTAMQLVQIAVDYLHFAQSSTRKLADYLKIKHQIPTVSAEGVAAIKLQCPDAQYVATAQEWRQLGYLLKPSEYMKSIKLPVTHREQYFMRDGKQVSVKDASPSESKEILSGILKVSENLVSKLLLVYDIAQTNCPPTEHQHVTQSVYQSESQTVLFNVFKDLMADKCNVSINDLPSIAGLMGYTGYYDENSNTIFINQNMDKSQMLISFCECSAACVVAHTSTLSDSIRNFESAIVALQFKQMLGLPIENEEYHSAAKLYSKIPNRTGALLNESLSRCRRLQEYFEASFEDLYRCEMDLNPYENQYPFVKHESPISY